MLYIVDCLSVAFLRFNSWFLDNYRLNCNIFLCFFFHFWLELPTFPPYHFSAPIILMFIKAFNLQFSLLIALLDKKFLHVLNVSLEKPNRKQWTYWREMEKKFPDENTKLLNHKHTTVPWVRSLSHLIKSIFNHFTLN